MPHRLVGEAAFFQRAEIRDVLAWLRLLADPSDAAAVVRALARPPIELRSVDIARCTQIARRRKLDMVAALAAATESPQVPPEARERIRVFLKLYRSGDGRDRHDASGPVRAPADRSARACAASSCSPRRPTWSSGCARWRGSASWRPRTCAARRRPRPASSPARSPRSRTSACASRRSPSCRRRRACRCWRSRPRAGSRSSTCTCSGCTPGWRRRRAGARSPTRCSRSRCRATTRRADSARCARRCTWR